MKRETTLPEISAMLPQSNQMRNFTFGIRLSEQQ